MRYRRIGQWGVTVSEVALGTWLSHGGRSDEDTAIACTRRAFDLGVNLFDTANVYPDGHPGEAERVLGKALAPLPRDTYLVATKVWAPMGDGPLRRGLSRKHVMAQVDGSLSRLGVDHIDLYQCHRYDPDTPVEETADAMNDLVKRGKIVYWGVSEWAVDQLEHVVALCRRNGWAIPISNQTRYSALWREPERDVLNTCRAIGMGALAYSPLAEGVLSGKYLPGTPPPAGSRAVGPVARWMIEHYFAPEVLVAARELRLLAEQAGYTAAQVALAWCLRRADISSVIVGASRLRQLEENVAAADRDISADVVAAADAILATVTVS